MNSAVTTLNQALDSQIVLEASNIPDDLVIAADIAADSIGNSELANNAVFAENVSRFVSTEQTGTGAEQSVAHSLARTPALVLVIPTKVNAAGDTFVTGTADGTNVKATVTTGAKYIFVAF